MGLSKPPLGFDRRLTCHPQQRKVDSSILVQGFGFEKELGVTQVPS